MKVIDKGDCETASLSVEDVKKICAHNTDNIHSTPLYVWLWMDWEDDVRPCLLDHSYPPEWGNDIASDYVRAFKIWNDSIWTDSWYNLAWEEYDKTWRCYPMEATPEIEEG